MGIGRAYQLAPLVSYDDYDGCGYLLDIRQGILEELNERDTRILSFLLSDATEVETLHSLASHMGNPDLETNALNLLTHLEQRGFLEPLGARHQRSPFLPGGATHARPVYPFRPATLKQRIDGAGHIVFVLNELRREGNGLHRAYQHINDLKATMTMLSTEASLWAVREEYWFYRLVTGLLERRIAHLLGQVRGSEGLCMIRAFAWCAYLLILGVPASIVMGRPKYGTRSEFKLHVWVELDGKPLNEVSNIRDRYRVLSVFPFYS